MCGVLGWDKFKTVLALQQVLLVEKIWQWLSAVVASLPAWINEFNALRTYEYL